MSKKIVLQEEFKTFISSLETLEISECQQILLSNYGGSDTMMAYNDEADGDLVLNNNNQGCNTINNCKGGNCVAGCGGVRF